MKPWIVGVATAGLVIFFFPAKESISERWSKTLDVHSNTNTHRDSAAPIEAALLRDTMLVLTDSLPTPADPFGLPPEPVTSSKPTMAIGPIAPPPPRVWHATGRVGERAAVLTSTDGRILVVSDGARVDSAVVVSIGNDGVVLEDRAGRFSLQIP